MQSLSDALTMIEFSRFPASLTTAAEIDGSLETAVRAASESKRGAIFDATNQQMARLDSSTQRQLTALRRALNLGSGDPPDLAVESQKTPIGDTLSVNAAIAEPLHPGSP
jgi:hypothetical protein